MQDDFKEKQQYGLKEVKVSDKKNVRLIKISELAEYMGLSKNTIYAWVCQKKIPYCKIGRLVRFDMKEIDRWIDDQKVKVFDIKKII